MFAGDGMRKYNSPSKPGVNRDDWRVASGEKRASDRCGRGKEARRQGRRRGRPEGEAVGTGVWLEIVELSGSGTWRFDGQEELAARGGGGAGWEQEKVRTRKARLRGRFPNFSCSEYLCKAVNKIPTADRYLTEGHHCLLRRRHHWA